MYYIKRMGNLLSDRHEKALCVGRLLFPCYDLLFLHSLRNLYRVPDIILHTACVPANFSMGLPLALFYSIVCSCIYTLNTITCIKFLRAFSNFSNTSNSIKYFWHNNNNFCIYIEIASILHYFSGSQ